MNAMRGLMLAFGLATTRLPAQQLAPEQVPVTVRSAYQASFPGPRCVEWKRKTDRAFEAEFKFHQVDVAAKFDSLGHLLETETTIRASALPGAVRSAITREFKEYRIVESQRLERMDNQPILWEVHVANANEIIKTQYLTTGTLQAKSAKPNKP